MSIIETRTAKVSLIEKGIVRVQFKPQIVLDKKDILENLKASAALADGRHCALLEVKDHSSITDRAFIFAGSKQNAKYRVANALLLKSTSVKLLWNFFKMFFKPTVHNKVFTTEREAMKWLRSIYSK